LSVRGSHFWRYSTFFDWMSGQFSLAHASDAGVFSMKVQSLSQSANS